MSLAPRLDLRQSQSLVMTPQLQQAIKLLALSNLEIESFVAEEIEKNPLLQGGAEEGVAAPAPEPPAEPATADRLIVAGDGAADRPLDVDYGAETYHHDAVSDMPAASAPYDGDTDFDAFAAPAATLHEHLLAQAGERLDGADLLAVRHLIDLTDETGYLSEPLAEVAARLGIALEEAERLLGIVQAFDPTGVGARDLAECIALQAREVDRYDPCMAALIGNLDLLARGEIAKLRRLCDVDDEDFADMVRELRSYDPRPGLRFGGEPAAPVAPDVLVRRIAGGWAVELNAATMPRVLVDRRYHAELAHAGGDREARVWLADRLAGANWLVKALDQRARTIVKVATELVKRQEGFFLHGVGQLRPLTLRAVADAVGLHESTVSRVTSNKYLSCERGLFELKYFFTSGVAAADGGEAVSAEAVKSQIARLIGQEGDDILSDDKLVDLLRDKGFDLARRTVAKYREAIGLGSSVQRRRARALVR